MAIKIAFKKISQHNEHTQISLFELNCYSTDLTEHTNLYINHSCLRVFSDIIDTKY